jgi:uncharacterized protein (DUF58 family)
MPANFRVETLVVAASSKGEFLYRIPGRPGGIRPGAHPSRMDGGAGAFLGLQPLLVRPNPRRLDLRRSLTDPFGQWLVRNMSERVSVPLYVIADVSASMATDDKREAVTYLVESAALSAWRAGDPFGFIAADQRVRDELFHATMHSRGMGARVSERLGAFPYEGSGADGLLDAFQRLGRRRALVLIASDFHFDLGLARQLLRSLAGHYVVPLVVWGEAESSANVPDRGFIDVGDSESAAHRFLWLRPRVVERIRVALRNRRAALRELFAQHGMQPVFIDGGFDPDRLTRHFLGGGEDANRAA